MKPQHGAELQLIEIIARKQSFAKFGFRRYIVTPSMTVPVVRIREVWMLMCQWFVPVQMTMLGARCYR